MGGSQCRPGGSGLACRVGEFRSTSLTPETVRLWFHRAEVDDDARSWWRRLGFKPFDPAAPGNLDPYLLTSEIEATLRSLG